MVVSVTGMVMMLTHCLDCSLPALGRSLNDPPTIAAPHLTGEVAVRLIIINGQIVRGLIINGTSRCRILLDSALWTSAHRYPSRSGSIPGNGDGIASLLNQHSASIIAFYPVSNLLSCLRTILFRLMFVNRNIKMRKFTDLHSVHPLKLRSLHPAGSLIVVLTIST